MEFRKKSNIVYAAILTTFSFGYTIPLPAVQLQVNDVAFMYRMEQLVNKLVNTKDKGSDKMIACLVDIKQWSNTHIGNTLTQPMTHFVLKGYLVGPEKDIKWL